MENKKTIEIVIDFTKNLSDLLFTILILIVLYKYCNNDIIVKHSNTTPVDTILIKN